MYSSPPLHQLSSESRHCSVSLGCLVSRIIHHLEHSWPPWVTKVDLPQEEEEEEEEQEEEGLFKATVTQ